MRQFFRSRAGFAFVTVALLLSTLAGSAVIGGNAYASSSKAKSYSITISNFSFMPMQLKVTPGATIKVTNKDSVTHTLTSTNGKFNTGNIRHNQTKSFTAPDKPGTYHYMCNIHQYMTGTIIVKK